MFSTLMFIVLVSAAVYSEADRKCNFFRCYFLYEQESFYRILLFLATVFGTVQ